MVPYQKMQVREFVELLEQVPDKKLLTGDYYEEEGGNNGFLGPVCCLIAVARHHFGLRQDIIFDETVGFQNTVDANVADYRDPDECIASLFCMDRKTVEKIINVVDSEEDLEHHSNEVPKKAVIDGLKKAFKIA